MNYRVAVVLSSNIEIARYYLYYTDCFDKINVAYDIISWDRLTLGTEMEYCFKYPSPLSLPFMKKIYDFTKYSDYIKKVLSPSKYDYVIVFTIANSIFLKSYLIRNFRNRFIIDIRDYSPIFPFAKKRLIKIFKNARRIYISTSGFRKWLPPNFDYIISHNVRFKALTSSYQAREIQSKIPLVISNFGCIRDYDTNRKLIYDLRQSKRYILEFNGLGFEPLKNYAEQINPETRYRGTYNAEDELGIIERADIINILFPRTTLNYANLNNRFYHALIHRKPVLVNNGGILADYVEKYEIGIVLRSNDNILEKLDRYVNQFDIHTFEKGCKNLTDIFLYDVNNFETSLKEIFDVTP